MLQFVVLEYAEETHSVRLYRQIDDERWDLTGLDRIDEVEDPA
jgi:hypothetical protein